MSDAFPDDVISHLLLRLIRSGAVLEPHDHGGVQASLSEVFALRELASGDGLSQNELARRLALEKSTVSRLVAALERRGWVDRARDEQNRRFVRLRLNNAGREAAQRLGEHFREHHRVLLARLSAKEREALRTGLNALARVIAELHAEHA
jgi:DNA-binding MarR family transcriptional regulator